MTLGTKFKKKEISGDKFKGYPDEGYLWNLGKNSAHLCIIKELKNELITLPMNIFKEFYEVSELPNIVLVRCANIQGKYYTTSGNGKWLIEVEHIKDITL